MVFKFIARYGKRPDATARDIYIPVDLSTTSSDFPH